MTPTIRPMIPDDIPLLVQWMVDLPLLQRYGLTSDRATANFRTALEQGDLLITVDAHITASGFAWAIPRGAFGRSPYLRLIAVRPDATGLGIGAALLDEIERLASALADDLFLLVSDFNKDAQRFYTRHGYQQVGEIPAYVQSNVTELILRKRLR